MRKLWTHAEIEAPAEVVWALLTDTDTWSRWRPSIRSAEMNGGSLKLGATGTVTTVIAAPYIAVCRLALHRIDELATAGTDQLPGSST